MPPAGAAVLTPRLLGRRVVVRQSIGPGMGPPFRDALGDLVGLDTGRAVVDTRRGAVEIALGDVAAVRVVEPSAADQLRLEGIAARGWRAREVVESEDGWLLRADAGWTGRANSALALRTPRRPLVDVLADVESFYNRRELPARIAVPLPAGSALDRALQRAGWAAEDTADVLVTRLDLFLDRLGPGDDAPDVGLADDASAAWLTAGAYRGGPLPTGAAELLQRHERALFAGIDAADVANADHAAVRGRQAAVARGALDDGWLGVTVLSVAPDFRRRGLATALLRRLATAAAAAGATRAYLQVATDNEAAHALYAGLGWHRHHSYVYRRR